MRIRIIVLAILFLLSITGLVSKDFEIISPDENIKLKVEINDRIFWSVLYQGQPVIKPSAVLLKLYEGMILGRKPELIASCRVTINRVIWPVVPTKSKMIKNYCNELILKFKGEFSVIFRVYDDGVAYRFKTDFKNRIKIESEEGEFNFADNYLVYFPEEKSFISHYERTYQTIPLKKIQKEQFGSLPVLVKTQKNINILLTEADLCDYPGMFLFGTNRYALQAGFPKVIQKVKIPLKRSDRSEIIDREADYIADTEGKRNFPWRVLVISPDDRGLLSSQMVFKLSSPLKIKDPGWIKPGKVAWDWWNALNIFRVDFESGINTQTYKYYIDFASQFGIEYVILDEGWSESTTQLLSTKPEIDLVELISYGKKKKVGIILWVLWKSLNKDMPKILDKFKKWGAVGIKVDFMQRIDQYMVNYYKKVAKEAAKRKLLVDFHGAFKPAGLRRAYPNVLTYEGVKGLEHCKWSNHITPDHNLTIPFIRMVAGPMDFTPGAMVNAQKDNFKVSFSRPMSQGTRCHQLAMYVIYESPLQMLCDSPSRYLKEEECTKFISNVPVTWDQTKVFKAKITDYIVLARKKGEEWYVAAMTDWTPRKFEINLSFLNIGEYNIEIFQDGVNADKYANDYQRIIKIINKSQSLKINLKPGGGFIARIYK